MALILLYKCCKFGEKICNNSRDIKFFLGDYFFLARPVHTCNITTLVVLVVALVERWTRDRKVAGSTPGLGAIKSTMSTQPSISLPGR